MSSKSNVSKKRVQRTEDIDEDVESFDLKEKKEKKDKKEKKKDKKEKKSKKDKSKKQRTDTFSSSSTSHGSDSEEEPNPMAISNYNVSEGSRQVLKARGIECFFPIQAATFDHILDGNDVLGRARTGTGKTIAFALPIVERLLQDTSRAHGRFPRVIVMSPTRELAKQIEEEFISLARNLLSVLVIYGGTPYEPQERALSRGVDIVVGTPGRIIDHIDRGNLKLDFVSYAVLDEADKMLSVGFADEMDRVLHAIPRKDAAGNARKIQTLLFSATIPPFVQGLCNKYMSSEAVTVDLVSSQELKTSTGIRHLALQCQRGQRNEIIGDIVKLYAQVEIDGGRTIVFTDTKSDANELALNSTIASECAVLHGDIAQSQREITLKGFREGRFPILVATDVAARGLDIQGVALVINVRPPLVAEDYIHRSGRTGRAGTQGVCITFFSSREEHTLKQLERAAGVKFERIGAPQKSDIIGAVVKTSLTLLAEVHPTMIELFRKSAAEAIAARDGDAVTLLAAALAHVAGFTSEMKPKSLLEGEEGYTTIQLKSTVGATYRSPKFVLTILEGLHTSTRGSDANTLGVKGVRLATDGSALADVPSDMVPKLSEKIKRDPYARFEITVPSSLPDLQERPEREPRGGPSSGRFGGDRRDSRNGGRFGGSSGRGSGGFGGFGRPGSSSSNSRGRGRW